MDLNDYFNPVSLERPAHSYTRSEALFGRNIRIHTPSAPIDEISDYGLALMGIEEERGSENSGTAGAPDKIRQCLYELYRKQDKLKIIDLGNLKPGVQTTDTYCALRDVVVELLNNQVAILVMGGSQDLTTGIFQAFERRYDQISGVVVDSRFDFEKDCAPAFGWTPAILASSKLVNLVHMGQQQYMADSRFSLLLEEGSHEVMRLGALHADIQRAEPHLRDSRFVSFDFAAIRQSDAPGSRYGSPNGLYAEEACQLARFAGLGAMVDCFGLFEVNPAYDRNDQTARLAAQVMWYFIDGLAHRKVEIPAANHPDFKVYLVNHADMEHSLTFYRSIITGRWWMEIPRLVSGKPVIAACSQEEYQQACSHEIPERWWKMFQRIN